MKFLDNLLVKITGKGEYQKDNYDSHHSAGSVHSSLSSVHRELFTMKQELMYTANQAHQIGTQPVNWSHIAKDEKRLAELKVDEKHAKWFSSKDESVAGGESLHTLFNECSELLTWIRKEKEGKHPTLKGDLAQEMSQQFGADGSKTLAQKFTENASIATAAVGAAAMGAAGQHHSAGTGQQLGDKHSTNYTGMGATGHREMPHSGMTGNSSVYNGTTGTGHQVGDKHTTAHTGMGVTGHREAPHMGSGMTSGHSSNYSNDSTGRGTQIGDNHTTAYTGQGLTGHKESSQHSGAKAAMAGATLGSALHSSHPNNDSTGTGHQVGSDHSTAYTGQGMTGHKETPSTGHHSDSTYPSMMQKAAAAVGLGAAAHHGTQHANDTTGTGHQIGDNHSTAHTGMGATGHREAPHMGSGMSSTGSYNNYNDTTGTGHQVGKDHTTAYTGHGLTGHKETPSLGVGSGCAVGAQYANFDNSSSRPHQIGDNHSTSYTGMGATGHRESQHTGLTGSSVSMHNNTTGMGHQIGDKHTTAHTGMGVSGHREVPHAGVTASGMGIGHSSNNDTTGTGHQIGRDHTTAHTGEGVTGHKETPSTGHHSDSTHPSMMQKAAAAVGLGAAAHHGNQHANDTTGTGHQVGDNHSTAHTGMGATGHREAPHTGSALQSDSSHSAGRQHHLGGGMLAKWAESLTGASVAQSMHGDPSSGINSVANTLPASQAAHQIGDKHTTAHTGMGATGHREAPHTGLTSQAAGSTLGNMVGSHTQHDTLSSGQHDFPRTTVTTTIGSGPSSTATNMPPAYSPNAGSRQQIGDNHTTAHTGMGLSGHREAPHMSSGMSSTGITGSHSNYNDTTGTGHQVGKDHTTAYTGQGLTGHKETPSQYNKDGSIFNNNLNESSSLGGVDHQFDKLNVTAGQPHSQHSEMERQRMRELERGQGY